MLSNWSESDKDQLLAAVNLLIRSPAAHELMSALDAAYLVAKAHPIKLSGEAEPLNALLYLRVVDQKTFDNLIGLVETKRKEVGFDSLRRPKGSDKFDKTSYMREFMAAKRARQRRAADIENMLRPQRDALRGRSRLDFMDRQSAKWKAELDALTEKVRNAHGGKLSKEQLDQVRDQFWSGVDAYLDEAEARVKSTAQNPSPLRPSLAASLAQLDAALRHDPYKSAHA